MNPKRNLCLLLGVAVFFSLLASHRASPSSAQTGTTPPDGQAVPASPGIFYPGPDYSYDSGWVLIGPNQSIYLTHNLGGIVDDYIVEMRFTSDSHMVEFSQAGFGGGYVQAGAVDGMYWSNLNTATIKITNLNNYEGPKFRVRIWLDHYANFDSGWVTTAQGGEISRPHTLGGNSDDYLVYMEFKDLTIPGLGINQAWYGGDTNASGQQVGAYWKNLTNSNITWGRKADDSAAHQVRVRMWKAPRPTYDSGWVNTALKDPRFTGKPHAIGGKVDDYIIDVQFRDSALNSGTDDGYGVHQRCYGLCYIGPGDDLAADTFQGAVWNNVTNTNWTIFRNYDDKLVDQVRIRIWNAWKPPRPDYDSGWQTTPAASGKTLTHNLGGSEDDYLVNLTSYASGLMTHQLYYGGKTFGTKPPAGYSADDKAGIYWRTLTSSSIRVGRLDQDLSASQFRVRIWRMPRPDYDSGWTLIFPGSSLEFNHGLTGDRADFLVDLSFKDSNGSLGIHQINFGGGRLETANGAYWDSFRTSGGNTTLSVTRLPGDLFTGQVRVRIWRVAIPDYESGYTAINPGQIKIFTHNLGNPDNLLVDLVGYGAANDHKRFYGRVDMGLYPLAPHAQNDRLGFYWYFLSSSIITAGRANEDTDAQFVNMRIWRTPSLTFLPIMRR